MKTKLSSFLIFYFRPLDLHDGFLFPSVDENQNITLNDIVRIAVSFDMGWFTRGTGRTYDSLSDTAAIIGYFTKKKW